MASTVWLHPRYWISRVRDSALLRRSSNYRVRRRYCHSVTGPSLCSEVLANFFTGISLCELPLVVFFPFSVRGQGLGTRRLCVTSCCAARKSTERELTCGILRPSAKFNSRKKFSVSCSQGNGSSHFSWWLSQNKFLARAETWFWFLFFSFFNRLLVTERRRLSHLFTRHIIHCAYVTYRCSMLDVCRVNQVPPTILH